MLCLMAHCRLEATPSPLSVAATGVRHQDAHSIAKPLENHPGKHDRVVSKAVPPPISVLLEKNSGKSEDPAAGIVSGSVNVC